MNCESLSLHQIQQESYKVLVCFDKICRENNFTYFLAYGTLLGAVRHKGFIPWDDDVDVWMPRKDFEAFENYCESHDLQNFKLCSRKNTKNYSYGIPRFCNMQFKYETTSAYHAKFDIGIFIDIYPLDSYGETIPECKKLWKKINSMNRRVEVYVSGKSPVSWIRSVFKNLYRILLHIVYPKNFTELENEKNS